MSGADSVSSNEQCAELRTIAESIERGGWHIAALKVLAAANELDRLRAALRAETATAVKKGAENYSLSNKVERLRADRDERERLRAMIAERELGVRHQRDTLREALGPDAAGRDFADLLETAAGVLLQAGGGPLEDCLRQKAEDVRNALSDDSARPVETTAPCGCLRVRKESCPNCAVGGRDATVENHRFVKHT